MLQQTSPSSAVVSRLAPSPTGQLHLGNIRTFLWAWLSARAKNGRIVMRIEDLDSPRVKPGVSDQMLDDLRWLGFDWDEGPGALSGTQNEDLSQYTQTNRRAYYRGVFEQLLKKNAVYPCVCTRGDIAAAQSAPHAGEHELRYPGICSHRFSPAEIAALAKGEELPGVARVNWRLRVADETIRFDDLLYGSCEANPFREVGDFIVAKAPDNPAYQLAVVADDIAMSVNEVVRGDDLVPSTARQLLIYRLLDANVPRYGHVPLVVGPDGLRLAKRHGEARIRTWRERGEDPRRIIALLARWSGLKIAKDACTPHDLIPLWSWKSVSRERIVVTPEMLR
jgi:glutamyl-tRNA synthetase